MKALYVHVPFCDSICAYCDFCRVGKNERLIEKWLKSVAIEIEDRLLPNEYTTIYLGGGTPTCLSEAQLEQLLILLSPYAKMCKEYTIEINPETLTEKKCDLVSKYGVNRVSIGVQTTEQELLNLIGRRHSHKDVQQCITWLRERGINNISCDCMYSLPTQTMSDLKKTLLFMSKQGIPHISIYSLTIEENSKFKREGYMPLDEDMEADMYDFIVNFLSEKGYNQYEISNFSLEGKESLHNLHYWNYDDFVGISIGASGKEENCRYDCTTNFEEYFKQDYFKQIIPLTKGDEMFEFIMMGLRLKKGISLMTFQQRFDYEFDEVYGQEKNKAITMGYLVEENKILFCTPSGFRLCNTVIEMFMK